MASAVLLPISKDIFLGLEKYFGNILKKEAFERSTTRQQTGYLQKKLVCFFATKFFICWTNSAGLRWHTADFFQGRGCLKLTPVASTSTFSSDQSFSEMEITHTNVNSVKLFVYQEHLPRVSHSGLSSISHWMTLTWSWLPKQCEEDTMHRNETLRT